MSGLLWFITGLATGVALSAFTVLAIVYLVEQHASTASMRQHSAMTSVLARTAGRP